MPKLISDFNEQLETLGDAKHLIFGVNNVVIQNLNTISDSLSKLLQDISIQYNKQLYFISGIGINELYKTVSSKILSTKHILCGCTGTHISSVDNDYMYDLYLEKLTLQERNKIRQIINKAISKFDLPNTVSYQILDRKTQITLACLGKYADQELKNNFDSGGDVRKNIIDFLHDHLPELYVSSSGTTSINITKYTSNKKICIEKLKTLIESLNHGNMIFIGNTLFNGNNDKIVLDIVDCIDLTGPDKLDELLNALLNQKT